MAATAKTITVSQGQSIQAAVDAAKPGDTVKVLSGDYYESGRPYSDEQQDNGMAAVLVTKSLTLTASGKVRILSQSGLGLTDGIVAEGAAGKDINGLVIKGFIVEGFSNNGIKLAHVKNFSIENNTSKNNEENGIWPTLSANGQVKKNIAYGAKDSALWIEASQNVRVIENELYQSPTGLEVTISKNVTMENNNIHDNTVGIGLYHPAAAGLPQENWPQGPYGNWQVSKNYVHDNNVENTAEGGEVALLPPGLGILILGVDRVEVEENRIEKNNFVGIGMVDWCVALGDPGCQKTSLPPGFEDTALDYNEIEGNRFAGNHTGEDLVLGPDIVLPASDILYLGADFFAPGVLPGGTHNCQSGNKAPNNAPALIVAVPETGLPMCDDDEEEHDDDHGHDGHGHDDHGHDNHGHDDHGNDDHHPH
jgi:parallel beta-helix repeat protein